MTERVIEKPSGQYSLRGCDEGGNWQKEGGEGGATTPNPNPNPNRGRGLSLARLECGQRQSRCSGALPLAAPAPLRIELRLLDFQNRRGEARILYLLYVPAVIFGARPLTKNLSAPKGTLPRAAEEKNEQRASSLICERYVGLMRANLVRSPVRRWWPA